MDFSRVSQRNWSRVGIAAGDGLARVFVKQFVDADGNWQEKQYRFETEGAHIAHLLFSGIVRVPQLLHADDRQLLHVYQYCEVVPTDSLLRKQPDRFLDQYPHILRAMSDVLAALSSRSLPPECTSLPAKDRPYGGDSVAVSFKGLDIRNAGIGDDPQHSVVMFDFGRPYRAPVEEAAAKVFVSVGLLNWGRPMRRFLKGPDKAMLQAAREQLRPYLDLQAVLAECEQQRRVRSSEIKATNVATRALKSAGVHTVGEWYFRALTAWCRDQLD